LFKKNSIILFQGDSITDGGRTKDGDFNHLLGQGYAYIIASHLGAKYPELNLNFINRGVSGNRIVDLYARWQEDTINLKPNVISILVGVNDVVAGFSRNAGVSATKFKKVYRMLIEETIENIPDIQIVLCTPFILPVGIVKENWINWKSEIDQRKTIINKLANDFNTILVEPQKKFDVVSKNSKPEYWIWDGIHPMPAGHGLLAKEWLLANNIK
jgi:lysophospholipase L1-like esterase